MKRLIEFLVQNPILGFVAVAWIGGILGNIAKSAKRRSQQSTLPPPAPQPIPRPAEAKSEADAEAVAREMRRILGEREREVARERQRAEAEAAAARSQPRAEPVEADFEPPPLPVRTPPVLPSDRRRNVAEPERPPLPVVPTTSARRLPRHIDPHVGETLAQRHVRTSAVPHELGTLGGRSAHGAQRVQQERRFVLDDLKRAFVLSEILGPPLANRRDREPGR